MASRVVRLKLFVWALISFGVFAGLTYLRVVYHHPEDWWFDPARDVALGVFPLGLSILVWEFLLRRDRDAEIIEHVEAALAERLRKLRKLEGAGITDVTTSLSTTELTEFLETAKRNITVIVPFFVDPTILEDTLHSKLQHRNFVVQIALLHPESSFLRERAKIVFGDENAGRQQVKNTLLTMKKISDKSIKGSLQVRTFDSLPSIFIVRCDERALVGFYLSAGNALRHPHISVHTVDASGASTTLGQMIDKEFYTVFFQIVFRRPSLLRRWRS